MKHSHRNLSDSCPTLLEQWHPTKNGNLTPKDFCYRSNKKVWWKCNKCSYEWEAIINNRIRNYNCPSCIGRAITENNSLSKKCPELAEEWHPTKNGDLTPNKISLRSGKKVWWKCNKCGYEWASSPLLRTQDNRITKCSKCNSLGEKEIGLSREWHPTKNGKLTPFDVDYRSGKKVWWKCNKCGHEWDAEIRARSVLEKSCPICNCLASQNPRLASEWNASKNGSVTPYHVTYGSKRKVWWKCGKCKNEWLASILARNKGLKSCFKCDSLGSKNLELSREWHPTKNGKLTPFDVSWGSNLSVWWKCSRCGFEWKARIMGRVDGNGCPSCNGVMLDDGTVCSSMIDAYFYIQYRIQKINFSYNKKYGGLGSCRYDFYFPKENKYVEVTGFDSTFKFWKSYLRRIVIKKHYVEKVLGAKFEFIVKKLKKVEVLGLLPYIKK